MAFVQRDTVAKATLYSPAGIFARGSLRPMLQSSGGIGVLSARQDYRVEAWPLSSVPEDVVARWEAFLAASQGPAPVLQSPASLRLIAALDPSIRVDVLAVRDDRQEIVGIAPVEHGVVKLSLLWRGGSLGSFRFKGVTLTGTEPLTADPELAPAVMECVLRSLDGEDAIEFRELKQDHLFERRIQDVLNGRYNFHRASNKEFWSTGTVPPSLDDYLSGLGKKKRYNLARQERLLAEHLGADLEFVVVRDAESLNVAIAALRKLTGWSGERLDWAEKDAVVSCAEGIGFFFVLLCKGVPVGLVRATASGRVVHIHSMHHDVTLAKFSPGTAVWQFALRWMIERQAFDRIVFAYGMPGHANRATNVVESRARVIALKRSAASVLAIAMDRLFRFARDHIKAVTVQMRGPKRAAAGDQSQE